MDELKFEDGDFVKSSMSNYRWVKACVMVAVKKGGIGVRDSKDPAKTTLHFTNIEWQAFIEGVKAGEFDLPKE